jgi:purine catabolism regulator
MSRQNGISLEDMLRLDVMGKSKLIAGFKGIRNTVSRVNVVADPDIFDWVQEGEFLLTTAYSFRKADIEFMKEFIRKASQNKLAGLGIKIRPYLDSLPQKVIDYADELNFPIVDIHYSIPLSDIMMEVSKTIFNKHTSLLERIERVHEQFMEVMLEGKSIDEVIEIVGQNIKNPVLLKLNLFNENIGKFEGIDEDTKDQLLADVDRFYNSKDGRSTTKKLYENKVLIGGKYVNRMIMPIVLKGDVYGHIFAWSTTTPLGGFDLSIIESASSIIALFVLQELMLKEVEISYRSQFFEDLISTDSKKRNKAMEKCRFFNLNPEDYYVVEVIDFKLKFQQNENDYLFDSLRDKGNAAVMIVEEILDYLKLKGIVSTKLNGIHLLLAFDREDNIKNKIDECNEYIINAIEDKLRNLYINIGIGRIYRGLDKAGKSLSDALKALRMCEENANMKVLSYDDLGIYKILSQDFLTEELEDFYNKTLKVLVDYDKNKSTELVKTLKAYFKYNGNLSKMSQYLYTHYNTVLYRINRIEEITGMNLNNPNDRLNLEIALKIKEIL